MYYWHFIIALIIAIIAVVLAVILGDYGPWYLSWVLGTGFMILLAVASGVLFEAQNTEGPVIKAEDSAASEGPKS
ncbi:MAG: hypothetical protein AB7E29_00220 [Xanthobacter sp.]